MRAVAERARGAGVKTAPQDPPALLASVLVPVTERPQPLDALYEEYAAPLRAADYAFEFVFAVEPWAADLVGPLKQLAEDGEPVRAIVLGQAVGETGLIRVAAAQANGGILLTLPSYRRIVAEALPALIKRVEAGADIVVARRWPRIDSWINRLQTFALHRLLGRLTSTRLHDIACGVRAMRRGAFEALELQGDAARFLPLVAQREGYVVEELATPQHPDDAGTRVYGPGLYLRRLIDVLGLFFLLRFREKPLRFFGLFGSLGAIAGALILLVVSAQRLMGRGLADRPLLLLGVLLVVLGAQAIALGLIGEIIVHHRSPTRRAYRVLE